MSQSQVRSLADGARGRVVDFCRRLIQTPSPFGQEERVAGLVQEELRAFRYDDVQVDAAGNVIGRLAGGGGRPIMLHAHMDIVDPGDLSRWSHDPYAGDVADGFLWGRGACDDKGSLAAQVYALGLLREAGLKPAGDVYLAAAVQEESGGVGTCYLVQTLKPALAVVGEPSANTLRRGHRGRFEFVITWQGRSAHASAPERGLNPYYSMSRFLLALRDMPMARDPVFGGSSVAPTLSSVDQTSSNVIPARISLHLDWRNAPSESLTDAQRRLEQLLRDTTDPGIQAQLVLRQRRLHTYTGLEQILNFVAPSFCLAEDDPDVLLARRLLEDGLQRQVPIGVWRFATDGGHLFAAGVRCIGFGPGDEAMAHVADERLDIEQLVEATAGYMALALGLGQGSSMRQGQVECR